MQVDELIRQRAAELHRVHAHDPGWLHELTTRARPRRRSQGWVLIGAALAVLFLFAPVALFLLSEDPTSSIRDGNPATSSTGGDSTPAESSGDVSIGRRLFEIPGGGGLGSVMTSGSDLIVTGFDTVLRSADRSDTWEVTGGAPTGDDSIIRAEAGDGVLLAVGAHDGASSRLYRSADYGATWEQTELPVPPGIAEVVPGVIAHREGEWLIAGVGTRSSFDTDATQYVWRSTDAVNWESEEVAHLQGFSYGESVEVVDGSLVIISRSAQDTGAELFALEETTEGWTRTELTSILETQAGLTSEFVNALVKGSGIVGDRMQVWWGFDDGGMSGQQLAAMVYRTRPGEWHAEPLFGVAPETVTITPDGLVGTAHPGTLAPMMTPGFTAIVASDDGVKWTEVGRIDGLDLRQLRLVDDRLLIAAGNETGTNDEGFATVTAGGIWEVTLSDDLASILKGP